MDFFVPKIDGSGPMPPDEAEQAWTACRGGAERDVGEVASDRRIYRVLFTRNGKPATATVGDLDPYGEGQRVMAIIQIDSVYKLCLTVRGFLKIGDTPMVGLHDAHGVEDFRDLAVVPR